MKDVPRFPNLHILNHPLIQHKLSLMREKETPHPKFRQLLREIALLMGYEITRTLEIGKKRIETPLQTMFAPFLKNSSPVVVPILRAGLGMAEGLLELIPESAIGHIGLYRDPKTKRPVEYLVKLPPFSGQEVILVDPMLATGHSAVHAVNVLKKWGGNDLKISFMALVAAPEGVQVFTENHPEIPVYVAALDDHLNEHAYILPGLGDAGDRLFGTK
jgi:uracil phosphoribosyltransferase